MGLSQAAEADGDWGAGHGAHRAVAIPLQSSFSPRLLLLQSLMERTALPPSPGPLSAVRTHP